MTIKYRVWVERDGFQYDLRQVDLATFIEGRENAETPDRGVPYLFAVTDEEDVLWWPKPLGGETVRVYKLPTAN